MSRKAQSRQSGSGRGRGGGGAVGPTACEGGGAGCAVMGRPDTGSNQPAVLVGSPSSPRSSLHTRTGTHSCLFPGCVNLQVQVHIDS